MTDNAWYYDPENITVPAKQQSTSAAGLCGLVGPFQNEQLAEGARIQRMPAMCQDCGYDKAADLQSCSDCSKVVCNDHAIWTEDGETTFCQTCAADRQMGDAARVLRLAARMVRGHQQQTQDHWEAEKELLSQFPADYLEDLAQLVEA